MTTARERWCVSRTIIWVGYSESPHGCSLAQPRKTTSPLAKKSRGWDERSCLLIETARFRMTPATRTVHMSKQTIFPNATDSGRVECLCQLTHGLRLCRFDIRRPHSHRDRLHRHACHSHDRLPGVVALARCNQQKNNPVSQLAKAVSMERSARKIRPDITPATPFVLWAALSFARSPPSSDYDFVCSLSRPGNESSARCTTCNRHTHPTSYLGWRDWVVLTGALRCWLQSPPVRCEGLCCLQGTQCDKLSQPTLLLHPNRCPTACGWGVRRRRAPAAVVVCLLCAAFVCLLTWRSL